VTAMRYVARIAIVALICALATMWIGWMSVPVVGFVYGIVDRNARARGTVAATGAASGWLAILCTDAARGADVRMVATKVGELMQIPAVPFVVATLLFAALLCGAAAVLGSAIGRGATLASRARL